MRAACIRLRVDARARAAGRRPDHPDLRQRHGSWCFPLPYRQVSQSTPSSPACHAVPPAPGRASCRPSSCLSMKNRDRWLVSHRRATDNGAEKRGDRVRRRRRNRLLPDRTLRERDSSRREGLVSALHSPASHWVSELDWLPPWLLNYGRGPLSPLLLESSRRESSSDRAGGIPEDLSGKSNTL